MSWLPWLLLAVLAVPVGFQIWAVARASRMRGRAVPKLVELPGTDAGRQMYYFHSPRCGACRAITPRVRDLGMHYPNLHSIDVAERLDLAHALGVTATPSFVLVEDGVIREVLLGAQSERKLEALLRG